MAVSHERVLSVLENYRADPALEKMQKAWVLQAIKIAQENRRKLALSPPLSPAKAMSDDGAAARKDSR